MLAMGGASHAYDGDGRRVQQTLGTTVTRYLLDSQPGLAVVLSATTGTSTDRYVHGPRGIQAQQDAGGNWAWLAQDGLGSARAVVDASGSPLWMTHYADFGSSYGSVGTPPTAYGFTGEVLDGGGLLDLRARRYAPGLGVFASLDPFEGLADRPMSLNGYSWVEGNVVNATDPSGMSPQCLTGSDCSCYGDNKVLFDLCQAEGYPVCPKPIVDSCSLGGLGTFSLSDNQVIYAIAIAIFGEGRFAGPEGIQLSAAAAINKIRNGNVLSSFGDDYGAALIGLTGDCGGYADTNDRLGVRTNCIDNVVSGIMSGTYSGGASGVDYPNTTAMKDAIAAVRSQLRYACGRSTSTGFIHQVQDVLGDVRFRIALTFHSSWNDDLKTLKCCIQRSGISDQFVPASVVDCRSVIYGDEGVVVSNINILSYAYDGAQNQKSASTWKVCDAAGPNKGFLFPGDVRTSCYADAESNKL